MCTCARVSLCVPAALATARSIRQMITISTNLPPQPRFGRSVSLNTPTDPPTPPTRAHIYTHIGTQTKTNHPHSWPTPQKANLKMKNYKFINRRSIWALHRQKFWDSELKLAHYVFYSLSKNEFVWKDHKISIRPLVFIGICVKLTHPNNKKKINAQFNISSCYSINNLLLFPFNHSVY